MSNNLRSNLWTFIIYPESMPNNYLNIINNWHIPCLISPLHNKDIEGSEEEIKAHYHVMLYFGIGANKSINQVKEFSSQLNGTLPFIVNSSIAMIRYFVHKDNPEKQQFDIHDLIALGGFDYLDAFKDNYTDDLMYDRIEDIINDHILFNVKQLQQHLKNNNMTDELRFFRRHTLYFKYLMDGVYQNIKNGIYYEGNIDKKQ